MDQRESLKKELFDIIRPYVPDEKLMENMAEHTHLLRDLKINSAHLVDIVLDVESKFDITIDDEAMERMNTVGDALEIITHSIENK